jgi:hypothetical protein
MLKEGKMNKKQELVEEIKQLNKKRDAEIQQLEYSLALEEAVPDVFSDGKVKVQWSSDTPHLWPEDWTMTITKGKLLPIQGTREEVGDERVIVVGDVVTVHLKDHPDADWINRIQKPAGWETRGGLQMRRRIDIQERSKGSI